MGETAGAPVIIQELDGSCVVHFPAGHGIATPDLPSARDAVNQYLGIEEDKPQRRIGFVVDWK